MRRVLAGLAAVLCGLLVPVMAQQPAAVPAIQVQVGDLLAAEARFGDALAAYRLALGASDADIRMRAGTGVVTMLLRMGAFDEARDEALALRGSMPDAATVRAMAGDALWAAGLFEEAEADFDAALRHNPDEPRARHGRARSLAAQSRFDAALVEAQAALRLDPREPEFHYTIASLYERMRRFDEAAGALVSYVNLMPNRDRSEKAAWSRAQIRYLRSFEGRRPFEFIGPPVVHTVPFRIERDKLIVRGKVNGGPAMDFIVDTGSEQTVISREVARRAGVAPVTYMQSAGVGEVGFRGLQVGRLEQLEIGTFKVKNVTCLIKNPPIANLPTRESESFSPLALGLSMTIDYGRRLITMAEELPDEPSHTTLPLRMHRLAMVRGLVGGNPVSFAVDTGGEVISISARTAEALNAPASLRRVPLKVYGTSGWDPNAFLLPYVDLAFSGLLYPRTSVVVLDLDAPSALLGFKLGGIVGHRFLRDYRVTIDLPRARLGLNPIAH
ncbi:MAG: retroviral-like aspartic protease family protein [Acidobacteriota bacterium]|nr:retroviral-like aspartic protease family protein [Acidobacteriota bacterium]